MDLEMFEQAIGLSPTGVAGFCPRSGEIVYLNNSFAKMLQFEIDELKGKNLFSLGIFADSALYDQIMDGLAQQGFLDKKELYLLNKNKNKISVNIYAKLINKNQLKEKNLSKNNFSKDDICILYVYDISHEVEYRKQLSVNEQRFIEMAAQIDEVYFLFAKNRFLYVSPRFQELWPISQDHLYKYPLSFLRKIEREDKKKLMQWIRSGKIFAIKEEIYLHLHGDNSQIFYLQIRLFSVKQEDDSYRMTGIVRDVTEKIMVEGEIRKLNKAIEQSSASIVITDKQGDIEYVNPQFSKKTGYSYAEAMGKNPRILKSGKQSREYYNELWQTIASGKVWQGEFENMTKDGQVYWELATIAPVRNDAGDITHYIAIKDEITKRKQMERELIEAKELAEKGMKAKSQFLSTMSHEIRTPMNGILGMTEMAIMNNHDENIKDFLETIRFSGQHLLRVINDILDVSKAESGKMKLEQIPFGLRELIRQLYLTLAEEARNKNIRLEYKIHADVPDNLIGDSGRLSQILFNIIGNAIKFTHHGKVELIVRMPNDDQWLKLMGQWAKQKTEQGKKKQPCVGLQLTVADTGIGIAKDKIPKIFDGFSQVHTTKTYQYGGTGLGLTISKKLTEMMHGWINVDSVYGQGSTFHIFLTMAKDLSPQKAKDEKLDIDMALPDIKIILADDNAVNQKVAKAFFQKMGYDIELANNGQDLLQKMKEKNFDIVFMDIEMPEMDGITATRRIRDKVVGNTNSQIPIIAFTAYIMQEEKKKFLDAGMNDIVTKPINMAEIKKVLGRFFPA